MLNELEATLLTNDITIMLSRTDDGKLSMIMIPKSKNSENRKTNIPLHLTGTIEEIKNALPDAINDYTKIKTETGNNIAEVAKQLKAIEEEEKKKRDEKLKKSKPAKASATPEPTSEDDSEDDLFDMKKQEAPGNETKTTSTAA